MRKILANENQTLSDECKEMSKSNLYCVGSPKGIHKTPKSADISCFVNQK